MSVAVGARRVLVAVQPRLLADTIARAIAAPDVDVIIDLASAEGGHFDVAVVSGDRNKDVPADAVVRLPTDGAAEGSITTPSGTEPAAVGDLPRLLEALHRLLRVV